jgi:hypothetical protein
MSSAMYAIAASRSFQPPHLRRTTTRDELTDAYEARRCPAGSPPRPWSSAVLSENLFIDNEANANLLRSPSFRQDVAIGHFYGIDNFFN